METTTEESTIKHSVLLLRDKLLILLGVINDQTSRLFIFYKYFSNFRMTFGQTFHF